MLYSHSFACSSQALVKIQRNWKFCALLKIMQIERLLWKHSTAVPQKTKHKIAI